MSRVCHSIFIIIIYSIYLLHKTQGSTVHRRFEEKDVVDNLSDISGRNGINNALAERKMKYCDARLIDAVKSMCKSRFYSGPGKRSFNSWDEDYRIESNIRKECCHNECNKTDLTKYCDSPQQNPGEEEFFTHPRKVFPEGYSSVYPIRTEIPRITTISLPDYTEEFDGIPTVQPRILHSLMNFTPGRRFRVPAANIILDPEEDDSIFAVGL